MTRKVFKQLKFCVNGDGKPVCPPSKVLCRDCLNDIPRKLEQMINNMKGGEK